MAKSNVYVSLCVDDLDARHDPTRSDRISSYNFTPEEVQQVLAIIKKKKGKGYENAIGFGVSVNGV